MFHDASTALANGSKSSNANNNGDSEKDDTEKEFENILNQLSELGQTIDQELSNHYGKTSATPATPSHISNKKNLETNQNNNISNEKMMSKNLSSSLFAPNTNMMVSVGSNNQQTTANYNHNVTPMSSPYHHNHHHPPHLQPKNSSSPFHQNIPLMINGDGQSPNNNNNNGSYFGAISSPTPMTPVNHQCHEPHTSMKSSYYAQSSHNHHLHQQQQQQTPSHHLFTNNNGQKNINHPHYSHTFSDSNQTLDNTLHDTSTVLEMSSDQLRTDSPDNDSAFSDSVSLISSEKSSSSSSSSNGKLNNNGPINGSTNKSGHSSQSMNSTDSGGSSEDNLNNVCRSNHLSQIESTSSISTSNESPAEQPINSSSTMNGHQQLFFEKNDKKNDDSADNGNPKVDGQNSVQLEAIDQILNSIDWQFIEKSFIEELNATTTRTISLVLGNETLLENEDRISQTNVLDEVEKRTEKKIESSRAKLEIEELIRQAEEKIREANIRKLYLKVFAEDDSAKCLLADERMSVGMICQHLAQKNHITTNGMMNYCIIEHMPQLYLERFYEDHESLVESVLYWGRDHSNKLYFAERPDKYDVFVQPEKYLISVSQPNENVDTLKSGSLRAKFNANQLRTDLIAQFFKMTSSGGSNNNNSARVPEIEGHLFLRSEGKKVWKKYFFSLRSSGLYYCPKGKPKSTKDLICLTTFELNCIYFGIGWKKKFKAPNDYGFAIKHPQIQTKSPKHIKYLCAESEDDLKLWMTGIRIAKYGRQLLDDYEQLKMMEISSSTTPSEVVADIKNKNNKISTFQSIESNVDVLDELSYRDDSLMMENLNHHHLHPSSSVMMRSNRVPRSGSVRSSSTSSSSGCISEQSSVVSTPSSGSGASNSDQQLNYVPQSNLISPSPHHSHHHQRLNPSSQQQSPLNSAFDADFPIGTIKRKPNVMIQPKIPLTNTTRNLALQSDDALLEVNDVGHHCNDDESTYCLNSIQQQSNSPQHSSEFQRGSFKTSTLRRSTTTGNSENLVMNNKSNNKPFITHSPHHYPQPQQQQQQQLIYQTTNLVKDTKMLNHHQHQNDDDLLPPPPPPPIINNVLKEAESTLSLNASFPPPPSPETLNSSPTPPPPPPPPSQSTQLNSLSMSNIQAQLVNDSSRKQQQQQQPNTLPMNLEASKQQFKPSLASLPLPPMTPQPQQKSLNRLSRRLSDLSENSTFYQSFRNQVNEANYQPLQVFAPNSRASIASSSDSTSFVTLKSSNFKNRFQRHHSFDYYQQQQAWSKYGTSPRLRMNEQLQQQPQQHPGASMMMQCTPGNYGLIPNNNQQSANNSFGSHCSIITDDTMRPDYEIPPTRVKVFAQFQQSSSASMLPSKQSMSFENGSAAQNRVENHYMSISPHLLQKHQQMLQRQQQVNNNNNNCYPNSHDQTMIYNTSTPYHVPEVFLKNMERVMQKKWHVAQMLSQDSTATPGQVLGFRDSAYLPPGTQPINFQMQPMNGGNFPQPASNHPSMMGQQSHYASYTPANAYGLNQGVLNPHHQHHHYLPTVPQPLPPPSSQYQSNTNINGHQYQKNVRISEASPAIISTNGNMVVFNGSNYHQSPQHQAPAQFARKVPPPPPKRSETTQLTTTASSSRQN